MDKVDYRKKYHDLYFKMHKPTDSVRVSIFDNIDRTRFLVVTESDDLGNWKLPGGKFEKGKDGIESPEDAAERELKEELGIKKGKQIGLCAVAALVNDDGVSARYIFAGVTNPELIDPTEEIAEAEWFTEETLPECKNRGHILGAVAAARARLEDKENGAH